LERYEAACKKLMAKFATVIPEGSTKARIRASRRDTLKPREEQLGSTLGEEASGLVTVDLEGRVMRYDEMNVMSQIVAAPASTVDLLVQSGKGWRRAGSVDTETDPDLDAKWKSDLARGTEHIKDTWVRGNDFHLDSKTFPSKHCYGTGSMYCEPGSGRPQKYCASRLVSLEQWFRRND
jgi:hypothetical protein